MTALYASIFISAMFVIGAMIGSAAAAAYLEMDP